MIRLRAYLILEDFQDMAAAAACLVARVCLQPDRNNSRPRIADRYLSGRSSFPYPPAMSGLLVAAFTFKEEIPAPMRTPSLLISNALPQ